MINAWRVILGKRVYQNIQDLQDDKQHKFKVDNLYINGVLVAPEDADWKLHEHLKESFERKHD